MRVLRAVCIALFASTTIGAVSAFGLVFLGFFGGYGGVAIALVASMAIWVGMFVYLLRSILSQNPSARTSGNGND
jgi:hypothetical protein